MAVQVAVWPRGLRRRRAAGPLGITWGSEARRVGTPVFMTDVGTLQSVNASTRYEDGFGGHDLASWTITPLGGFIGGMFRPGDHVRVTEGGAIVWEGELSEVLPTDDGDVQFNARGYAYNLGEYDSVYWNAGGTGTEFSYPTTQLREVSSYGSRSPLYYFGWEYAIEVLGMPITQGTPSGTSPRGDSRFAEAAWKLAPIVTENHREQVVPERWCVWGRSFVAQSDPTDPMWSYDAPEGMVGIADTEYATHVGVWHVKSGDPPAWSNAASYSIGDEVKHDGSWWRALLANTNVEPESGSTWEEIPKEYLPSDSDIAWAVDTGGKINLFDTRTVVVDYRGLGQIAGSRALDIAEQLLAQVKGQFVVTGSFKINPESGFKSADGGAVRMISLVRAGQAVRLTNLRTSQGNLMPDGDVHVIGRTEWSWEADETQELTITPMGPSRDVGGILAGNPGSGPMLSPSSFRFQSIPNTGVA